MTKMKIKTRRYVENDLKVGGEIRLEGSQGHHLARVMRVQAGDHLILFNGRDGEWRAEVIKTGKGKAVMVIRQQVARQIVAPDLWYLFAPIKKARLDYMVEKATELGVSLIRPVMTARTNLDRLKTDKIRLNAIFAAEQCGRMSVPTVDAIIPLEKLLDGWPEDRLMMFCDEEGENDQNAFPVAKAIDEASAGRDRPRKWAILIGPEGGFSPEERRSIRPRAFVVPVSLGPRILRADTAAIVAIALWQSCAGDWRTGGWEKDGNWEKE